MKPKEVWYDWKQQLFGKLSYLLKTNSKRDVKENYPLNKIENSVNAHLLKLQIEDQIFPLNSNKKTEIIEYLKSVILPENSSKRATRKEACK